MPDEERDAYLDTVLIGGREPVTIVVRDYDPAWPDRFETLRARIVDALGTRALDVQHIGSTSVPGLAAKPIIDILVTVAQVEAEDDYAPPMYDAGFALRVREPGHRMFRTPERKVHVHVYEPADQAVTDYLDLRDWLRFDDSDRTLYAVTKRDLARREWTDMNAYADAKSAVIAQILARAREWRSYRPSRVLSAIPNRFLHRPVCGWGR
ncbi:GrpB family protein [Actinopolymorpha sp. NPDC004070]|uniref:GrpB family protein n=1 Tax=Actinopolymorpha sp. NPDC004070 TaxID=3154548 RepID=UPI0033A7C42B